MCDHRVSKVCTIIEYSKVSTTIKHSMASTLIKRQFAYLLIINCKLLIDDVRIGKD